MTATVHFLRRRNDRIVLEPAVLAGRPPPHDLDNEAAVLAAILCEGAPVLDQVRDILEADHFYSDANRRIYEAVIDLADGSGVSRGKVDIVLVAQLLRDRGWMGQIGGPSYLAQLADQTPAVAHVRAHALVVFEKWRLRQLIATCQRITAEAYGDVGVVQEFIEVAEQAVHELAPPAEKTTVHVGEIVGEIVNEAYRRADEVAEGMPLPIVSTGIPAVDAMTNGLHGLYYLLIGAPRGGGKSAMLRQLALSVARQPVAIEEGGHKRTAQREVLLFSMEMPRHEVTLLMNATLALVNARKIRKGIADGEELVRFARAGEQMRSLQIHIDDSRHLGPSRLRAKVRRAEADARSRGNVLSLVGIDYLQLMKARSDLPRGATREEEVSICAKAAKDLAADFPDTCFVVLAQLNASGGSRESAAAEQDAGSFWRLKIKRTKTPGEPDSASVDAAKQRNDESDVSANIFWHRQYTLFSDDDRLDVKGCLDLKGTAA